MRNLLSRGRPLAAGVLAAGLTLGGAITAIPAQAATSPAGPAPSSIAAAHTVRGATPSRAQLIGDAAAAGRTSQAAAAAKPNLAIEEWKIGPFGTGVGGYAYCTLTGTLDFDGLADVLYWYCSPDPSGQWYLYVWIIDVFGGVNRTATAAELSQASAHRVS